MQFEGIKKALSAKGAVKIDVERLGTKWFVGKDDDMKDKLKLVPNGTKIEGHFEEKASEKYDEPLRIITHFSAPTSIHSTVAPKIEASTFEGEVLKRLDTIISNQKALAKLLEEVMVKQ